MQTQNRTRTLQVTCITKPNRDSTHEAITHLGGVGWYSSKADVIAAIEAGTHSFYTNVSSRAAWVRVREGKNGKFVQTVSDGQWSNNLLALPDCR